MSDRTVCATHLSHFQWFRTDEVRIGGSFHVVDYNSTTGAVIRQRTSQGYADNRLVKPVCIRGIPSDLLSQVPGHEVKHGDFMVSPKV